VVKALAALGWGWATHAAVNQSQGPGLPDDGAGVLGQKEGDGI
jgi:hypothetical protein